MIASAKPYDIGLTGALDRSERSGQRPCSSIYSRPARGLVCWPGKTSAHFGDSARKKIWLLKLFYQSLAFHQIDLQFWFANYSWIWSFMTDCIYNYNIASGCSSHLHCVLLTTTYWLLKEMQGLGHWLLGLSRISGFIYFKIRSIKTYHGGLFIYFTSIQLERVQGTICKYTTYV
jgi:hypothetical protein